MGNTTRILLVAATEAELPKTSFPKVDRLTLGVGMVSAAFELTKALSRSSYSLVINVGIAGSFNTHFPVGSVVQVVSDRLVELGVEDHDVFIPAHEMGLIQKEKIYFETDKRAGSIPEANGVTVNRVHGSVDSILRIRNQFSPDVESMEGAAVAFVCQQFDIPWVQLRAISNVVEPRNRASWNIPLALKNLHATLHKVINKMNDEA